MDKVERIKMVKAMEYITRQINNEEVFEVWLWDGVADGDIEYGDLSVKPDDEGMLYPYYETDEAFADTMETFLWVLQKAIKDGGLYCDGVVSMKKSRVTRSDKKKEVD